MGIQRKANQDSEAIESEFRLSESKTEANSASKSDDADSPVDSQILPSNQADSTRWEGIDDSNEERLPVDPNASTRDIWNKSPATVPAESRQENGPSSPLKTEKTADLIDEEKQDTRSPSKDFRGGMRCFDPHTPLYKSFQSLSTTSPTISSSTSYSNTSTSSATATSFSSPPSPLLSNSDNSHCSTDTLLSANLSVKMEQHGAGIMETNDKPRRFSLPFVANNGSQTKQSLFKQYPSARSFLKSTGPLFEEDVRDLPYPSSLHSSDILNIPWGNNIDGAFADKSWAANLKPEPEQPRHHSSNHQHGPHSANQQTQNPQAEFVPTKSIRSLDGMSVSSCCQTCGSNRSANSTPGFQTSSLSYNPNQLFYQNLAGQKTYQQQATPVTPPASPFSYFSLASFGKRGHQNRRGAENVRSSSMQNEHMKDYADSNAFLPSSLVSPISSPEIPKNRNNSFSRSGTKISDNAVELTDEDTMMRNFSDISFRRHSISNEHGDGSASFNPHLLKERVDAFGNNNLHISQPGTNSLRPSQKVPSQHRSFAHALTAAAAAAAAASSTNNVHHPLTNTLSVPAGLKHRRSSDSQVTFMNEHQFPAPTDSSTTSNLYNSNPPSNTRSIRPEQTLQQRYGLNDEAEVDQDAEEIPLTEEEKKELVRGMFESYFSDRRIWGLIQNLSSRAISHSGWCSILPVTAFSKVTRITTSIETVVDALRRSEVLQLSQDGTRVRRLDRPNLLSSIASANSWRNTVYMLGFPQTIRKSDLYDYFATFGRISTITLCPSQIAGATTTVLAEFVNPDMAARCINHGGHTFRGYHIEIVSRRTTKRKAGASSGTTVRGTGSGNRRNSTSAIGHGRNGAASHENFDPSSAAAAAAASMYLGNAAHVSSLDARYVQLLRDHHPSAAAAAFSHASRAPVFPILNENTQQRMAPPSKINLNPVVAAAAPFPPPPSAAGAPGSSSLAVVSQLAIGGRGKNPKNLDSQQRISMVAARQ